MTSVLGLSAFYHDSAAALVVDGALVAAAQEERFTRKKHDAAFPAHAIDYCLREAGIAAAQLDAVAFYDKPILKFERLLETYLASAPRGLRSFLRAMPLWLGEKLRLPREIDRGLGGRYTGPIYFPSHHESHAASAFFPSPFDEAAILTVDGVGEWSTSTWGVGRGHRLSLAQDIRFPHSLGLLYSAFTYYAGFTVNSGEYKLMGLAPYGEPKYAATIRDHLIDIKDDGSFWLDQRYFDYCAGLTMTNDRFHRLFGRPPRRPESPISRFDTDIAASIQRVTEEVLLKMARHVAAQTGMSRLCLAGGVALNCVANGVVQRDGPFDEIWIQPAAGDAGGALGAALFTWHQILNQPRTADPGDAQRGSYLGPSLASADVRAFLAAAGAPFRHYGDDESLSREIAKLIAAGKVVGLVMGRMEFGPRALGARSIVGDARNATMQSTMNLKIKFRESFRPFAPSVLVERAADYFALDAESPYMMLVAPVREERRLAVDDAHAQLFGVDRLNVPRSDVPAVTHVDYTARIQTVDAHRHPRYRKVIEAFERETGCAVIVNTSFNIRGEPIVCGAEDAYRCFMFTDMDALVLEDVICLKDEQPPMPGGADYKRSFKRD